MRQPLTVIGMSDLHGLLVDPDDLPPGDVYCICGDIVPLDVQSDTVESIAWLCTKFLPWVEQLKCSKCLFVAGNHDFIFQTLYRNKHGEHRKPKRVLQKLMAPAKLTLLDDSEFIYKGYRFYGSPWVPNLPNWAFYADHDKLVERFDKIPANVDVLITHCPPRIMDFGMVTSGSRNRYMDYGCEELREAVLNKKPKLHIFGHVHTGRHSRLEVDGTTYANVSIKDEDYQHAYDAQIFNIN